jgi:hypothetical protein
MRNLKHVGKIKNTGAKVLVVFRCLPGETGNALVLPTATLPDAYHDAIIQLVDSEQGQDAFEFGEIMFIRHFPDGRSMLTAMQQDGRLQKVATENVLMTPKINTELPLSELNALIAEQRGIAIDELPGLVTGSARNDNDKKPVVKDNTVIDVPQPTPTVSNEPLSDKDLAKTYRSQADAMYKEAARLRREADDIDPPQKKLSKVKEAEDA